METLAVSMKLGSLQHHGEDQQSGNRGRDEVGEE